MKQYVMEVNLKSKLITLYRATHLDDGLPSPFDTTEGWAIMILLGVASVAIYILAYFAFIRYEDHKKNESLIEAATGPRKKARIL